MEFWLLVLQKIFMNLMSLELYKQLLIHGQKAFKNVFVEEIDK